MQGRAFPVSFAGTLLIFVGASIAAPWLWLGPILEDESFLLSFDPDATYTLDTLQGMIGVHFIAMEEDATEKVRNRLYVDSPDGVQEYDALQNGSIFEVDGDEVSVEAIGTWSGLYRDVSGAPMAAISLRDEGAPEILELFLVDGHVLRPRPGLLVLFVWHEDKKLMEDWNAVEQALQEQTRWGVREGISTHWFQSFIPGTGLTLRDGRSFLLLEVRSEIDATPATLPAIHMRTEKDGETSDDWYTAEQQSDDGPVVFQHPSAIPNVILIQARREDSGTVSIYNKTARVAHFDAELGLWSVSGGDTTNIRIDDLSASAVPITEEDSSVQEIVLNVATTGRQVHVRQGEATRLGDSLLRFEQDATSATYRVAVAWRNFELTEYTIPSHGRVDLRGGPSGLAVIHEGAADGLPDTFVISTHRRRSSIRLLLAVSVVLTGLACLAYGRRKRTR